MKYFKEEGEPTNSISAGSMDSHEATDGASDDLLTRKGKKKKKKKLSKYQEYKESMDVDCNSHGWFEMSIYEEEIIEESIEILNISSNDYKITDYKISFKHEEDMYNLQDLLDNAIP